MTERNLDRDLIFDEIPALSYDGKEMPPQQSVAIEDIPWAEIVEKDETQIEMEDIWFQQENHPELFPLPPIPVIVFVLFLIAFLI